MVGDPRVDYKCCEGCLSQAGLVFEDSAVDELEALVNSMGGTKQLALQIANRLDPGKFIVPSAPTQHLSPGSDYLYTRSRSGIASTRARILLID